MPASSSRPPPLPDRTLVVDNGSYTIKALFASAGADEPTPADCVQVPNCIARTRDRRVLVGAQLESCRDFGGMAFRRPVEKGYLVNWEAEKEIWDRTFLYPESPLKCDPHNTTLVLTEAPNTPSALQTNCDQMVFEEYEFAAYYRTVGASLIPWNPISQLYNPSQPSPPPPAPAEVCLVVDSGFSHTHITPVIHGRIYNAGVRRIDVGGKFLTNYLKETVSLRTWNMMEEPYIINAIKEAVCFVSTDFAADLESCKRLRNPQNPLVRDYVLPDYNAHKPGYVRNHVPKKPGAVAKAAEDETVMVLANERFCVPELLFSPADVGLRQAGVAEAVLQSLDAVPERLRAPLLANVVLVGGNVRIPGFRERFEMELRPAAPAEAVVRVAVPQDPVTYAALGGARLVKHGADELRRRAVTRQEYLEHGTAWAQRRFNGEVEVVRDEDERERARRSHKKRRVSEG